jgi:transposase
MWVATQDLPRSAAHPFYARLNHILDEHDFDGYLEGLCERFYADEGRPGLAPGRYFRLLLIGYFEGLDAERAIAWRAADSFGRARSWPMELDEASHGAQRGVPQPSAHSRSSGPAPTAASRRAPGTALRPSL